MDQDQIGTDTVLSDRIQSIVNTEKQIDDMMKCAKEIISDLGKEKQIGKGKMEDNANQFKRLITTVENELSAQMQYLSHVCVGSSHQGSTFGTHQNSLLAQSGISSLHAHLAEIVATINAPSVVEQPLSEDLVTMESEGEEEVEGEEDGEDVNQLTTSSGTNSVVQPSGGSAGPRSQEVPEEQEEKMEE